MNEKEVLTEVEEPRCRQSSLLSMFDEIAHTFLSSVIGERENAAVFTSVQEYLDGPVLVNGGYCRRRTVLLAVHDLKDELEAPPALKSETRARLELLHVRPIPQVTFYRDIATAILRMEVVIRLEAMQASDEVMPETAVLLARARHVFKRPQSASMSEAAVPLAPARHFLKLPQSASMSEAAVPLAPALAQTPAKRRWAKSRVWTMSYRLAAVACCAGALMLFQVRHGDDMSGGSEAQLAVDGAKTLPDAQRSPDKLAWLDRDCIASSNDRAGNSLDGAACTVSAYPAYDTQKGAVMGNSLNAAEFVMYSAVTEAGFGAVGATSSPDASSVPETPHDPSWATRIEANYVAKPEPISEVKTR